MKCPEAPIQALAFVCVFFLVLISACTSPLPPNIEEAYKALPETVDFNFDVKPILSDRCFKCHGPDNNTREANLRLDLKEFVINTRLESGQKAIVPGRPAKSAVIQRILHHDPAERMPPVDARLSLSDREKALLIKWIEQGAEYKPHWSFIPPQKHPISSNDNARTKSPIDIFIEKKLAGSVLTPAPEATKETWLRRVSFDLTGLPPSIEDIDHFLADTSDTAYERVANRLLASKHFGERMATDWLDLSRYADTHGYQDDGYRFVWPWRDWVVKAFNNNLPYDQFLTWQLAGDLLPNATQEQRLATTFLRNHRINSEAGIIGEEYRVEYVADRTNTVGTAILGLTLECARCHDHKYDPISQKEYYQLFSYFNNVRELGEIANEGNPAPLMPLASPAFEMQLEAMQQAIKKQEHKLNEIADALDDKSLPEISTRDIANHLHQGMITHLKFETVSDKKLENSSANDRMALVNGSPQLERGVTGNGLLMTHYDVIRLGKETNIERTKPFSVSLWVQPPNDSGYVPIWGNAGEKNDDFRGYELYLKNRQPVVRLCHAIPHNYIEVAAATALPEDDWVHIVVTYDGSSRADGIHLYVNGQPAPLKTNWDNLYKSIKKGNLRIAGANSRGGFSDGLIDEFRYYDRTLLPVEVDWLFDGALNKISIDDRKAFFLQNDPAFLKQLQHLEQFRNAEHEARDTIPEIMVMEEMSDPRPTHILRRGVYDAPAARVVATTPAIFNNVPPDSSQNRLGLAKWLTSPDHPLTSRVAVNRFWQMFFGQGLVSTPGDWGNQGALPTHPELLDWLAITFVESGWDVKSLCKEIVLSATYRQSSKITSQHLTHDPDNNLLARGPVFRLSAEMIRDQALAASGLLVRKMGGPPVKPYQPAGLWKELAPIRTSISSYQQDHGENLYRRSLYTFWKRSSPPPSLAIFDAPTRELCLVQRSKTSTPLQALVLWNDPQFVEAARFLAERMMHEKSLAAQITTGFRSLTGRIPTAFELEQLSALFQRQLARLQNDSQRACALLSIGEQKRDQLLDAATLASLTVVAQTIMSYDAAVMRR